MIASNNVWLHINAGGINNNALYNHNQLPAINQQDIECHHFITYTVGRQIELK